MYRTALIHEWLVSCAGSEKVFSEFLKLWPNSKTFVLVDFLSNDDRGFLYGHKPQTSFIQKLPWAKKHFRKYLPLFPIAVESFDISDADIIISSSHAVAKGVLANSEQMHISYVHSPMRYAWDLTHQYLRESGLERGLRGFITRMILHYLRNWDVNSSNHVDYFVANSHYVSRRIFRVYRRNSTVIHPPVDIDKFALSEIKDDYYLTVSRLVPYKKINLIVQAFALSGRPLIVIGDGPDRSKVEAALKPNIKFLGYVSDNEMVGFMKRAKAFVFTADEDFGILSVEAQSTGTPVIAFGRGGSLETVKGVFVGEKPTEAHTGIWFREQTPVSINSGVEWFEQHSDIFQPEIIRCNAESFSIDRFRKEMINFVDEKWEMFKKGDIVKRRGEE